MDLLDRAKRFVKSDDLGELPPLLADCVAAGNSEGLLAVKLLARDMYGGFTYNWELKAPAAYCLLAWGQAGLKALVENALEEPTSKNFSLALKSLASIAEGHQPELTTTLMPSHQYREAVSQTVGDWSNLVLAARRHLHELILGIEDDKDANFYVGAALHHLAFGDNRIVGNLIHALALRSIAVGPKVLATYEGLLAGPGNNESVFQRFFESHPLLLDPRSFQVWAQPDLHGRYEPDFVIRTYDNSYVIVEIETPAKQLVTQQYQLSSHTTHAITQVLQYQEYLRTHLEAAVGTFPEFTPPSGLVVVGRESSLDAGQKAVLRLEKLSRPDITIVGFDTLADTAREITSNVVHGIPGTILDTRLK